MINNLTVITKACHCDNPQIKITLIKPIRSGKNFGKNRLLCYCSNCKAQWWKLNKEDEE